MMMRNVLTVVLNHHPHSCALQHLAARFGLAPSLAGVSHNSGRRLPVDRRLSALGMDPRILSPTKVVVLVGTDAGDLTPRWFYVRAWCGSCIGPPRAMERTAPKCARILEATI